VGGRANTKFGHAPGNSMARLSRALHAYEHLRQSLNEASFWVVPFCEIFDRIQSLRRNDALDLTEPSSMGLRFWALIRRSRHLPVSESLMVAATSGNASNFHNPFDKTTEQT
jgi:hypothetical protein